MQAQIIIAAEATAMARVREPGVQAVIVQPQRRAEWEVTLAVAVESGAYRIARCKLLVPRAESLVHVLEQNLPEAGLAFEVRLALIDDIAQLAEHLAATAGCRGLMLRLFTEAPSAHCGFHVDTVAPGRQPFGILKVYNGAGTAYVDPADVRSPQDFYRYLSRRERLAREWRAARERGAEDEAERLRAGLRELDATLAFLHPAAAIRQVPAGAMVAFRHLDVREHWSPQGPAQAWIHCSPMEGVRRLVLNLTPLDALAARPH